MNRFAVIALGSNLGDSRGIILRAMALLHDRASSEWRTSSLYSSTPVDCPPESPHFVNATVSFLPRDGETPHSLLDWLLDLEKKQGRLRKGVPNEARPLDLDLIAFGDLIVATDRLILPHPRAHLRRFVLEPMAEILPTFVFPGFALNVSEMLGDLPLGETVICLSDR